MIENEYMKHRAGVSKNLRQCDDCGKMIEENKIHEVVNFPAGYYHPAVRPYIYGAIFRSRPHTYCDSCYNEMIT